MSRPSSPFPRMFLVACLVAVATGPVIPASSAATRHLRSTTTTAVTHNAGFAAGKFGWARGTSLTTFDVVKVGLNGGPGAQLTAPPGRVASLRTSRGNAAIDAQTGDRFIGSAWVRATSVGQSGSIVLRTLHGSTTSSATASFTLYDTAWHKVSVGMTSRGSAPNVRLAVNFNNMAYGARGFVDSAAVRQFGVSRLIHTSFDRLALGPMTPSRFQSSVGGDNPMASVYDDTSVAADTRGHGRVIRTTLQANTMHTYPSGNNGIVVFVPLRRTVAQACVSYDIRFDASFPWSLGGKLPGLLGVAPGVAPSVPSGGNNVNDLGWSGRLMWLGPGAYYMPGRSNLAVSYMYHPQQKNRYGDNVSWRRSFVRGSWHTVKQCYRMNTPGVHDGRLTAWFDGKLKVDRRQYLFRTRSDVKITHLSWSIFRGGDSAKWAANRTGHIDIDNLLVTTRS